MSFDELLDTETLSNPMYWLLTGGTELALLIGFKAQGLWTSEMGMTLWTKLAILGAVPILAYFLVGFISRR